MAEPVQPIISTGLTASSDAFENIGPSLETVTPEGDVVFVVGPEKQPVLVNSAVMKINSPVFAAMLGPNFIEGNALAASKGTAPEIHLPEDNSKALIYICKAIHCRDVEPTPTSTELLEIVQVADKYCVERSLRFAAETWIATFNQCSTSETLWKVLVTAYALHCPQGFKQISRRLLMHHEGPFWYLTKTTPEFEHGALVALAHETVRHDIQNHLMKKMVGELFGRIKDVCSCVRHTYEFTKFMNEYHRLNFWEGIGTRPLADQFRDMSRLRTNAPNPERCGCSKLPSYGGQVKFDMTKLYNALLPELEEMQNRIYGVCLESLKDDVVIGTAPLNWPLTPQSTGGSVARSMTTADESSNGGWGNAF